MTNEEKANKFYVIDLEQLKAVTLSMGKDYEKIKNNHSTVNSFTDLYIINEYSQNVFYAKGLENSNSVIYYTDYTEADTTKVDLRYIKADEEGSRVLIPNGYYYIGTAEKDGENVAVISNTKDSNVDTTNVNQYTWERYSSTMKTLPNGIQLSDSQNQQIFFDSVNYYKGYFVNINGNVQYANKPKGI